MNYALHASDDVATQGATSASVSHPVATSAVTWNVVEAGSGPPLLLLHGTGSSTHSWRELLPLLATRFRVIAPDLPGHAASVVHDQRALSLPGMAQALGALLRDLALADTPLPIVGHSAGAALAVRALLDHEVQCDQVVAINGAFRPFGGAAGQLLSPLSKVLASSGWLARKVARRARVPQAVERLLKSTGSTVDQTYVEGYRTLFQSPPHVAATFGMMANWDLWSLQRQWSQVPAALHLLAGDNDLTVPAAQSDAVARVVPNATVTRLPGLGHLAHEEAPDVVAQSIFSHVGSDIGAV